MDMVNLIMRTRGLDRHLAHGRKTKYSLCKLYDVGYETQV